MPEETPEQKATREADEAKQRELDDRIARGVTAGIKPLIEAMNDREKPVVQTRTETVSTIQRPTDDQLASALIDGNKAEYARLMNLVRAADRQELQRELGTLASQGGSAISSLSQSLAEQDPDYKRFKKEIDAEMAQFKASNPGVIVTREHLKICTDMVKSRHIDEIVNERLEESRRQAREKEEALLPDNSSETEEHEEVEPTSLAAALPGDWKREFREKARQVGGRTDEEELRTMSRKLGFKDDGSLKSFLNRRKQVAAIEDEVGSGMGLDRDWVWTDKAKGEGHWVN
jgi:hypothetical protein